jgi:hypothetical protein
MARRHVTAERGTMQKEVAVLQFQVLPQHCLGEHRHGYVSNRSEQSVCWSGFKLGTSQMHVTGSADWLGLVSHMLIVILHICKQNIN